MSGDAVHRRLHRQRFERADGVSASYVKSSAMPPLRLAVDARVIAEDTRGIGRYARAVLRRLVLRDDIELTLLADGFFPQARRAGYTRALGSGTFAVTSRVPKHAEVIWHPANGTFFS